MFESEVLQRAQCIVFEEWNASLFDLYISEFNLTALISRFEALATTAGVLEVNKSEQYREQRQDNGTEVKGKQNVLPCSAFLAVLMSSFLSSLNACATSKESSSWKERNNFE